MARFFNHYFLSGAQVKHCLDNIVAFQSQTLLTVKLAQYVHRPTAEINEKVFEIREKVILSVLVLVRNVEK